MAKFLNTLITNILKGFLIVTVVIVIIYLIGHIR
jgi:hypothetical protein